MLPLSPAQPSPLVLDSSMVLTDAQPLQDESLPTEAEVCPPDNGGSYDQCDGGASNVSEDLTMNMHMLESPPGEHKSQVDKDEADSMLSMWEMIESETYSASPCLAMPCMLCSRGVKSKISS